MGVLVSIAITDPTTLGPFTDANGASYHVVIEIVSSTALKSDYSQTGTDESWLFLCSLHGVMVLLLNKNDRILSDSR